MSTIEGIIRQNTDNPLLKVTSVRYFETNKGIGYQCKTNIDGINPILFYVQNWYSFYQGF